MELTNWRMVRLLGISPPDEPRIPPADAIGHLAIQVAFPGEIPENHNRGALNTDFDVMCMFNGREMLLREIGIGKCALVHVDGIW